MAMPEVTLANRPVGAIGFGLMGMTWRPEPQPFSKSIETMKAALELGATNWNGGELYGTPDKNSCHLLNEYFTKYPEDASKIVLSIKGGLVKGKMRPDGSEKNVRRSVEDCLAVLDGKKTIDLFECARVDPNTPIEETIRALKALQDEGKIGGISLSEVRAETIRRAAAVAPISAVEIELSLWAPDVLSNGIAAICGELDIPIIAYSPLARGTLTGDLPRRNADIPDNDIRKHQPRYQDDVLENNNKLIDEVQKLAERKGCTNAQIAISWVSRLSHRTLSDGTKLGTIIPIPGATTVERTKENLTYVNLSDEEMDEIGQIMAANPMKGDRVGGYFKTLADG